jgi:hypothetical protein
VVLETGCFKLGSIYSVLGRLDKGVVGGRINEYRDAMTPSSHVDGLATSGKLYRFGEAVAGLAHGKLTHVQIVHLAERRRRRLPRKVPEVRPRRTTFGCPPTPVMRHFVSDGLGAVA